LPAVQVTVSRAPGSNGGSLQTYFAGLIGTSTIDVSATAVAAIATPGVAKPGALFPVAITQCMLGIYWNSTTNQPTIDPSTGQPYDVKIGSSYHTGTCYYGQWTTFDTVANDTPTVINLINNGNPTTLSIGSNTWIDTGTKNSIYKAVPTPIQVLLPIVADVSAGSNQPIIAFAPFEIDKSVNGSNPYLEGHFITNYLPTNVGPGGGGAPSYYGAYIPPVLVN
jgi:hypothetical protein